MVASHLILIRGTSCIVIKTTLQYPAGLQREALEACNFINASADQVRQVDLICTQHARWVPGILSNKRERSLPCNMHYVEVFHRHTLKQTPPHGYLRTNTSCAISNMPGMGWTMRCRNMTPCIAASVCLPPFLAMSFRMGTPSCHERHACHVCPVLRQPNHPLGFGYCYLA